jgi:RNA polymerase sigma-70 factor (ECF subfamily)
METMPAAGEIAEQRAEAQRVRRAVMKLSPAQSVPIWLHYFEGLSLKEISEIENTPESTVRSRIKAGLGKLSIALEDLKAPSEELRGQSVRTNEV